MPENAFNLAQVLWDEHMALNGGRLPSAAPPGSADRQVPAPFAKDFAGLNSKDLSALYPILNSDNRWALCLSGGGIRSAAFALGILQCFAGHRVVSKKAGVNAQPALQEFDYLSTVSGGGYIGSWLSAWLYQARTLKGAGQAGTVLAQLNDRAADHQEAEPIGNLRRNSHYLAPKFSGLSADVWTDIAAITRNLLLNWLLFLPPLMLLVLLTKGLAYQLADASMRPIGPTGNLALTASAVLFVGFALTFAVANRPARGIANLAQMQFLCFDLLPFVIGAILLVFVLITPAALQTVGTVENILISLFEQLRDIGYTYLTYVLAAVLGIALYAGSWVCAFVWYAWPHTAQPFRPEYKRWHTWLDLISWCLAGAVFGVLIFAGLQLLGMVKGDTETRLLLGIVAGIPWILLARIVADVTYAVPAELIPRSDANLEYQSRAGGIFTLVQLGWIIWFGLILFGSFLAHKFSTTVAVALAGAGGFSGAIALLIGSSSKTSAVVEGIKKIRRYLTLNNAASIMAAVFGAVLLIVFSMAIDSILSVGDAAIPKLPDHPAWSRFLIFAAALLIISAAAGRLINVNRYSLHGLYRNRLVRGFLGASRSEADRDVCKNQFTDFDSADSPLLYQLWELGKEPSGDDWKPLHVINVALNLVSSKNLAWQERMAAPFTFSPLHSGSASSAFAGGAFRRSYPFEERRAYGGALGLTLGTAMAISGAAVSPNMGYNSSPGLSFLMTLFNVRLGWWLGNPSTGNEQYWYTGPGFALRPFVMEMFGLTSEKEPWIYLSDGGHFENLGIYEMVRRRCRVIVVSDAGCDPHYLFDDLGNALRKIWIDLGIRIDFVGLDRLKKRFKNRPTPATEAPYWAVGQIRYRDADGGGADGWLLYIKSGLHGTECMDVLSYASTHLEFPHETTANQFFTESQFESYRALGFEIAYKMLCYGERRRRLDAAPDQREAIMARPINEFHTQTSTLRLDEIIARLRSEIVSAG